MQPLNALGAHTTPAGMVIIESIEKDEPNVTEIGCRLNKSKLIDGFISKYLPEVGPIIVVA